MVEGELDRVQSPGPDLWHLWFCLLIKKWTESGGHWRCTAVILATWEIETGRIVVPSQSGKKVCETPSQWGKSQVWCYVPVLPVSTLVQAGLGKKWDPISKITKAKRAGGMAQTVECLPWVQIPVPPLQKRKREKRTESNLSCSLMGVENNNCDSIGRASLTNCLGSEVFWIFLNFGIFV
jgi:hypothetical protein